MPSMTTGAVGESCTDEIGKVTCGAGQWCVQEMNVNQGNGTCASFCDPTSVGSCGEGLSCVAIRIALTDTAPIIHVCGVPSSDGGILSVDDDAGEIDAGSDAPADGPVGDVVGPNPILGTGPGK
jgi:hypothetical protein